ncbi:cbb3-type cytochrome c oxidase subunit I [Niastella yeongjuensis]|nr:cbb3-type cytochrome c oxidase subunit I [Niastella yeongjuensis]SEO58696.1 cytochrome c oxidase cbb3-type subunit 1 [Niastella yeongjuensis]
MKAFFSIHSSAGLLACLLLLFIVMLGASLILAIRVKQLLAASRKSRQDGHCKPLRAYLQQFDRSQLTQLLSFRKNNQKAALLAALLLSQALLQPLNGLAQPTAKSVHSMWSETGVLITLVLIAIPVCVGVLILAARVLRVIRQQRYKLVRDEAEQLVEQLAAADEDIVTSLVKRKQALEYQLTNYELAGREQADDEKGLLGNVQNNDSLPFVPLKKKAVQRPPVSGELSKLVLWFLGCASFWLVFGTSVGEYIGVKFMAPDADHVSWLSFGRLRPVHTNVVFWGWASMAMLGLAYYVVPRVGNNTIASIRKGWWSLILINAALVLGTLTLMAGINNAGGEYREWIWPVMALFALGLLISLGNFLQTIARRTTKEIYISNWYIVSALIFTAIIVTVGYLPFWQDGLGETIVQGYYMHQAVGMWFMLFTLGLVYYFLPQQLNRPIYSYSLGILAFWAQIVFYTLIGTHHFVFSSIPWWLQTVAIVGSAGMIIPVVAGTTNFLMTFSASRHKISSSYTLPFFLVGVIFYFTGSLQGTAEAFRSTNLIWHFTDFTVAHSHITMYGIISFLLWACIYAIVPRLTGKEAPQITVGTHFWLALAGLLVYTVPLMYGATLKGLMWKEGKPFIDGVVFMAPYWLWRAIGGSLMWLSHLFFAWNMYKMLSGSGVPDVKDLALEQLKTQHKNNEQNILSAE